MSKRPVIDLSELIADTAVPMREAVQRTAEIPPPSPPPPSVTEQPTPRARREIKPEPIYGRKKKRAVAYGDLVQMAFRVTPAFNARFRQRAFEADLYQMELLEQALEAWEEKHGKRKI